MNSFLYDYCYKFIINERTISSSYTQSGCTNNGALLCFAFGYFGVDIFSYMHYNDYNSKMVKKMNSYRQKPDIFSVL